MQRKGRDAVVASVSAAVNLCTQMRQQLQEVQTDKYNYLNR